MRSDLGSLQARGEGKVLGGLSVREWEAEKLFFVFGERSMSRVVKSRLRMRDGDCKSSGDSLSSPVNPTLPPSDRPDQSPASHRIFRPKYSIS
jgi:hypothetical protein